MKAISPQGVFIRFIFATVLVFCSYNPEGYSYYDWVITDLTSITPLKALAGLVLLIGWIIYIRASLRSLGIVGLILASTFFGVFIWLVIDLGWIAADNVRVLSYLILLLICAVLTVGLSWSLIRRRMSGQVDVDEIDEE